MRYYTTNYTIFYCPYCGYSDPALPRNGDEMYCENCKRSAPRRESKFYPSHYELEALAKYGNKDYYSVKRILIEREASNNPLFLKQYLEDSLLRDEPPEPPLRMKYCPVCGYVDHADHPITEEIKCVLCENQIVRVQSEHLFLYYFQKAREQYGDAQAWRTAEKILVDEEASKSPRFIPGYFERYFNNWQPPKPSEPPCVPRCPTCGSTNIHKISTASKVVGAAVWGLLSTTAKSQFKCGNCGYKW